MATTKITNPELFDLASLDTALKLPSGTTAERPTSPSTGEWRYNTDNNLIEFWDGSSWYDLQDEEIPPVPSENFNTVLYTGNGSTQSITGVGFQPDFVWIKDRSGSFGHRLIDSTTGADKYLESNSTSAQQGAGGAGLTSFDSDGFSLGSGNAHNANGNDFVAWCWKLNGGTTSSNTDGTITSTVQANTKAGFSIVSYTGDGNASSTVGHGLGAIPELTIFKTLSGTSEWNTYLTSNNTVGFLNNTTAFVSNTGGTNGSVDIANMSSTTFGFLNGSSSVNNQNGNGSTYIMYAFKSVAGYSKIGTYTGNGSTNGPIVETGFEPAFLMVKNTSISTAGSYWAIYDNKRTPSNPRDKILRPNTNGAEFDLDSLDINFLSNGFQVIGTYDAVNGNGNTFLYIAFASDPSTAPVLADSFNVSLWTGDGSTNRLIQGLGFQPSFVWLKSRSSSSWHHFLQDQLRTAPYFLGSQSTSAEATTSPNIVSSFDSDGFTIQANGNSNNPGDTWVSWNWKANSVPTSNTDGTIQSIVSANANAGFSIIKWTAPSSGDYSVGHGLSSTPNLVIIKPTTAAVGWLVWHENQTNLTRSYLRLNTSDAEATAGSSVWGTGMTSTTIGLNVNATSGPNVGMIAYCFNSVSGFSKFGSYTGTGSTGNSVNVGFQPDYVMQKKTSGTGSWNIIDSKRGDDNYLSANLINAEASMTAGSFVLTSTGFTLNNSFSEWNASGATYIYMAFKENPTPYPLAGNMSFLVVAGGGSGAMQHGGGGGAGGLRTSYGSTSGGGASAESDITLAAGTYTITVGSGANGVTPSPGNIAGLNGSDSSIAATGLTTITSIGGGGGSAYIGQTTPGNGGSGGGGGNQSQAGGSGTAGQGFAGGTGSSSSTNYPTGGGGGASAVGGNGSGSTAGDGGAGLSVSITGSSVAYAGGAGGSSFRGGTAGIGGIGGGANGTNSDGDGNAGTVNTGGGGGGATAPSGGTATSGNGGSGIVILRLLTSEYSSSTTGSPTVTTDGDYTVLTYTGSGTYVHS